MKKNIRDFELLLETKTTRTFTRKAKTDNAPDVNAISALAKPTMRKNQTSNSSDKSEVKKD